MNSRAKVSAVRRGVAVVVDRGSTTAGVVAAAMVAGRAIAPDQVAAAEMGVAAAVPVGLAMTGAAGRAATSPGRRRGGASGEGGIGRVQASPFRLR